MTESLIPIEYSCAFQFCMETGLFQRIETFLPATARKSSVIVTDKKQSTSKQRNKCIETSKKCPDEKFQNGRVEDWMPAI